MKNAITKPFETLQETKLLFIGSLLLVAGSLFAFLTNTRFDGVLDMHLTSQIQWYQPLIDNIINTLCLTVTLFILSRFLPTKARLIDIFNVALICRVPLYFSLFVNIGNIQQETTDFLVANLHNPTMITELPFINLFLFGLSALVGLTALVFMGFLLYRGYKNATNSKQASHHVLLIVAVLLAEVVSKLLVYLY